MPVLPFDLTIGRSLLEETDPFRKTLPQKEFRRWLIPRSLNFKALSRFQSGVQSMLTSTALNVIPATYWREAVMRILLTKSNTLPIHIRLGWLFRAQEI